MKHLSFFALGRYPCILLMAFFITINNSSAQSVIGRQNVDQYPINAWNTMTYGLTWLPSDYATNTSQKYPLIIFLHGSGEGGDGVGGLYNLASQGLPYTIANGVNPEAINPVDGQNYKFIVVSPQAPAAAHWSYSFGFIQYILPDIMNRYRVDPSRIYITGLSAGGAGTLSCVTNGISFAQKIAAIVPVCAAGTNTQAEADQIPFIGGAYGVKVWSVCGSNDSWLSFATSYTSSINNAVPAPSVPAILTSLPGLSHQPAEWNTPYYTSWRSNAVNMNIFEWMLQYTRATSAGPLPNQSPVVSAGQAQSITLPTNSTPLTGSATDPDGTIASYTWSQLSGPSQATFSSSSSASTFVNSLIQGNYSFKLTVTDNAGATATSTTSVTVDAVYTPPATILLPARIEAESYASMSGIQTESTGDAGGGLDVGWQENNDWMDYVVNVAAAGSYTVNFRVATVNTGVQFQLRKSDGTVVTTVTAPNTGGWQSYQTVSAQVNLAAGQQTLRVYTTDARGSGWNINWMDFISAAALPNQPPVVSAGPAKTLTLPVNSLILTGTASDADGSIASYQWSQLAGGPSTATLSNSTTLNLSASALVAGSYTFRLKATDNSGASSTSDVLVSVNAAAATPPASTTLHIEAESYASMSGIQTESTGDAGGGLNVGWQENNDWMDYVVNVAAAGSYTVNFRVATVNTGVQFQLRKSDGTVVTTITAPNTGGWQSYQTVSAQVNLAAGQQTLRVYTTDARGSGWNINWWEIAAAAAATPPASTTLHIEAESYASMSGIQTESTGDAGGGLNVGWQENNDWMDYVVNVAAAGSYTVNFRVATVNTGVQFQLRKSDGTVVTTITAPNTGGWQSYQTVSAQVNLAAGQQTLRVYTTDARGSGWNINWWEIAAAAAATPPASTTLHIEAESYASMSGIQTESTGDAGGGLNVGWQENNDWMDYVVNVAAAGSYTVNFRVATVNTGVQFQLRKSDGTVVTTVTAPNTGGWQSYQTVSAQVNLAAGQQTLRVYTTDARGSGWNINWWEIAAAGGAKATVNAESVDQTASTDNVQGESVRIFPNPVSSNFVLQLNMQLKGKVMVQIFSTNGGLIKQFSLNKNNESPTQFYLSADQLPKGEYILKANLNAWSKSITLIKL